MSRDTEIFAEIPSDEQYESEPESIKAEGRAEDHLRCLSYWQRERKRIETAFECEIAKIEERASKLLEQVDRKIAWHETGLRAWLWSTGAKSIKLLNGTLKRIKGRERIEILDEETFLSQAPPELISERIVRRPDKKAILARIKETGELPPGIDLVRSEDSFKVDFA